jgi:hypothetical protein
VSSSAQVFRAAPSHLPQHQHGMSEEVTKRFLEVLDANARALEKLAEVLGRK